MYFAVLIILPFISYCCVELASESIPSLLDRIIREKIKSNKQDYLYYTTKIVDDYPEMCRNSIMAQERIDEFIELESLKSGEFCDQGVLKALLEDSVNMSLTRHCLKDFVSKKAITIPFYKLQQAHKNPFIGIEMNIYSRQLIADYDTLLTVMMHADQLYKIVHFRKMVLFRISEIFTGLCSQMLLACGLQLIDARDLTSILHTFQSDYFRSLPDVMRILERKRKWTNNQHFDTDFDLNGLVDKSALVKKQSPLTLKETTLNLQSWRRCQLPCTINNITASALLRLADNPSESKNVLREIQSEEFKKAEPSIEQVRVDDVTISNLTPEAFSYNLHYYLYPLNMLLVHTENGAIGLFNDEEFAIMKVTVSLFSEFVESRYKLYVSILNGNDNRQRSQIPLNIRSNLDSIKYLHEDCQCIKARLIMQFVFGYISSLYDYENASHSSRLLVYTMSPCVDFKSFFENSIKKQSVLYRMVLAGDGAQRLHARFSRVLSLATYWIQVFSFKNFQPTVLL